MKENLLRAIEVELNDTRFDGLIHGTRNAAARGGCHGPLCQKYHRDKGRLARARRSGTDISPPRDPLGDLIINKAIAEHTRKIMAERAEEILVRVGAYKVC